MRTVARGLGWLSLGLGLIELLGPRQLSRGVGLPGQARLLQGYGLREIASGVGILRARDPTPWVWARVAGDALDLGTLAVGLGRGALGKRSAIAIAAVAGVMLVDFLEARALERERARKHDALIRDYSSRSGLPLPPAMLQRAAREHALETAILSGSGTR